MSYWFKHYGYWPMWFFYIPSRVVKFFKPNEQKVKAVAGKQRVTARARANLPVGCRKRFVEEEE